MSDKTDIMYTRNGYWRVIKVQKFSYVLWSYTNGIHINQKRLKHFIKIHNHKNMMEFIDNAYRLLTDAEKVLYVSKK